MSFERKVVLIVGATGGLGTAIAVAFAAQGAQLILAARRPEALAALGERLAAPVLAVDVSEPASIEQLRDTALAPYGRIDIVVNAAGYDLRGPLEAHTPEAVRRTLDVNLFGAIELTRQFLPLIDPGTIVHLGGFGDGRLTFPYFSADVASRAGLRSFVEAVNRESALAGRRALVSFFGPSPADTAAERPYHPLWRQMGTTIVSPERVADELLLAVRRRRPLYVMGGPLTRAFAAVNSLSPGLADAVMMRQFGRMLRTTFGPPAASEAVERPPGTCWRSLGLLLVVLSFVAYGLLLLVPLMAIEGAEKVGVGAALVATGELTFWIGAALLGRELAGRIRTWLNPRTWCRHNELR